MPADVQLLPQSLSVNRRIRVGHGLLLGDFNESSEVGEVRWIALIEQIDHGSGAIKLNWKACELNLAPTTSGAHYWRSKSWFGFDPDVADRYRLDEEFAEVFKDVWTANEARINHLEDDEDVTDN